MKNLSIPLVIVSLILSLLIGLAVSRQNGGSAAGKHDDGIVTVGLSLDTLKEARWQRDRDIFVERIRELGADVKVLSANSDDARQMQDVQSLISSDVDVIVIVPHDGKAMAKAVNVCKAAGIPVIAYDRMIVDCDLDLYTSFDNVKVGEAQAQYLVDHLPTPGKGKIFRIYGAPTDNNAKLFKQGQDNVLEPYIARGDITVLHEDWAMDWEPQNAKKITNAAITQHGDSFDAILASNDGTAGGAIQALKEEGLAGKKLVTGQDADIVACQRVVEGTQAMTIYKPLKRMAVRAAEIALDMAAGKPIIARDSIDNGYKKVPSVLVDIMVVDKDNMVETVIADQFHTLEAVYRNVRESDRPMMDESARPMME